MSRTATMVKDLGHSPSGARQKLYKMDPPHSGHEYVVVSAVVAPYSGAETYIFPATESGDISDFGELDGSQRGTLSHEAAIEEAGYELASAESPR